MPEWKDTVNLPRTEFPMKANLPASEPETLARWSAMDLYRKIREQRAVAKPGYFLTYFPGQKGQFDPAYLRVAMMSEYAPMVDESPPIASAMVCGCDASSQTISAA